MDVRRADMELAYCFGCGHLFNQAFIPQLMNYDHRYENSLHFSPHFCRYAEALVERLVSRHQLRDKQILEIGCGAGEVLKLFREHGVGSAIGLEPGYSGHVPTPENVKIRAETYGEQHYAISADLIYCRHVLEHVADPVAFLRTFRANPHLSAETVFYFEVPNALHSLTGKGYWDFIYEHCSYFSPSSLQRIFEIAGFEIVAIYKAYGDQFLGVEAKPGTGSPSTADNLPGELQMDVQSFAARFHQCVDDWRSRLSCWHAQHQKIALWGAGSKGVTFANIVASERTVATVIDVNPRKTGKYIPVTGQPVLAPESLKSNPHDVILVMNPVYQTEIAELLGNIGVSTEIVIV